MAASKKDTRFLFTSFLYEQAQTTHEYKGFQREIQDYGFQIIKSDTDTVKVYRPELALILTSRNLLVQNRGTETNINGFDYLKTYIEAYKEGEQYFENEIKVSPNTLYGVNAEQYVRDIHFNFFHANHDGVEGWGYVKTQCPLVLTHQAIKKHGYYSGIVSKVEEQVKKHPKLFATFDKCDHDTPPPQEQPTALLPNELSPNEMIMRQEELFLKADRLKLERKKLNAELMAEPAPTTESDKGQMNNIDEWAEWITRNPELAEKYYPKLMQKLTVIIKDSEPFLTALIIQKLPDHFPKWKTEADQYFGIKRAKMLQGYIDLIKVVLFEYEYPSEIEQQAVESVRDELAEQLEYWEKELNALPPKQGKPPQEQPNTFCRSMSLSIPKEHFKKLIENNSKNGKPFLTSEQYSSFIERAFCGNAEIPKQKINQAAKGEKLLIQSLFYEFYENYCIEYFQGSQCQDGFIKLLTDNFVGWDFQNVKNNFKPKTKKRL